MEREKKQLFEKKRRDKLLEGDFVGILGADIAKLEVPSWYNEKKFKRAKELYKDHFGGVNFAHFCGLLLSYYFPKITKALMFTGESSSKNLLFYRYVMTIIHLQKWYEGDVWGVNDPAHRSLSTVRWMHARVGKKMASLNDGFVYLSQWEMAATQWALVGPIVLFKTLIGINGWAIDDYDAIFHFWRTIGYLLGIEDQYNMCHGSYDEIVTLCEKLLHEDYKPMVEKSDPNSVAMAKDVTEAICMFIPFFTWPAIATYIYKLVDVPCPVNMSVIDKICYYFIYFSMTYLIKFDKGRTFINNFFRWKLNDAEKKVTQMMEKERSKNKKSVLSG